MFWSFSTVRWVIFYFTKNAPFKAPFSFSANILVYVIFNVANNSAVSIRLSIVNNRNGYFFLVSYPVLANCKIRCFISCYVWGNIGICINSKSCVKCSNTDLRVSAKLYRPNLSAVDYSLLSAVDKSKEIYLKFRSRGSCVQNRNEN